MGEISRLGILDSFSQGFSVVHRHPWLFALPLLLSLFLWLGPSVTAGPLARDWLKVYIGIVRENPSVAELQGATVAELEERAALLAEGIAQVNLLRLLAFQLPSLPVEGITGEASWEITGGGMLVLLLAVLLLAALFLGSVYLTLVAEVVRTPPGEDLQQFPQWVRRNWLHLIGYYVLLAGVSIPLIVGLTLFLMTAMILSTALASILISLSFGLFLLAQFYLYFVPQAIVLRREGPVRAIWHSALVMGRFFWSSLGFILLSWVIGTGFTVIFARLYDWNALGAVTALLGHAYISTGLIAAAMVYFQNRTLLLAAARDPRQHLSVPG